MSLTCPNGQIKPGTSLAIPVTIVGSGGGLVAFQWTVTVTPSMGTMSVASAGSAANAAKSIFVSGGSIVQGGFGPPLPGTLNATPISDGTLATLGWTVPQSLAGQTVNISIAGGAVPIKGTNANGDVSGINPGPTCAVSVLPNTNFCDINGDGVVTQADVDAQRVMVLTFPQPAKCARNADGCWVGAIQIVTAAALGGQCTATQ